MRIYLDNCCLERPYDDQDQDRIRLEAESVLIILRLVGSGSLTWVGSDVLICESRRIRDPENPTQRDEILRLVDDMVLLDDESDIQRLRELQAIGFGESDAGHVAAAEKGGCDVLLTTDDQLLSLSRRHRRQLRVRVASPVEWAKEVLYES